MSNIKKLLTFPLIPIGVYELLKNEMNITVSNTDDLINIMNYLDKGRDNKNSILKRTLELIFFDLQFWINHPQVSKRKSTATTIEERIAYLGDGLLTDVTNRQNPIISDLLSNEEINNLDEELKETICSNHREKGDVQFHNNYKLSVKSLISDNKEINFGAVKFTTLLKDILDDDILIIGERKQTIIREHQDISYTIGRGSKPQLKQLFKYINALGKWTEFLNRCKIVFKGIYSEDILIYIKNPDIFEIHIISNQKFQDIINTSLSNYFSNNNSVLNRWEGNSIRMERDYFINNATFSLKLNFDEITNSKDILSKLMTGDENKKNVLLGNF